MVVIITKEKHQFDVILEEEDEIQIYINGNPIPKTHFIVNVGYTAKAIFGYNEIKNE